MLTKLHERKGLQLVLGLGAGIVFGFLLQKGGVTKYDVIVGQLLLENFVVVKIMLSAVLVGMIGVHVLSALGLATLRKKPGTLGATVVGGLIFGVGFATLGYCPGTLAGAIGNGYLDALVGGLPGILIGCGVYAAIYPKLQKGFLAKGPLPGPTWAEVFKVKPWVTVAGASVVIVALLAWIELAGR
ncbi:MAG TPA: YeeE/YedE thiosulfate transporter family protein [Planctomycetota bacterium]|nr:YeeE/YedE thiosulfate transporter family protein [Planctomycetota bacterium]